MFDVSSRPAWGARLRGLAGLGLTSRCRVAVVMGFALLARFFLIALRPLDEDPSEMQTVGVLLAETGQLVNVHHALPTGPTAHVAPLYPALVAATYRVLGALPPTRLALRALGAIAIAALVWVVVRFIRNLGESERAGAIAAALVATPIFVWVETFGQFETPFTAVALALMLGWAIRHSMAARVTARAAIAQGAGWGLVLHLTPRLAAPMLLCLGACVLLPLNPGQALRGRVARAFVTAAIAFAAVLPYTIWNHERLGGWFFIRDNFGVQLAVSNGPGARASARDNGLPDGGMARHPGVSSREAALLRDLGEVAYDGLRMREALTWIGGHPVEFVRLSAIRWLHFWVPYAPEHRRIQTIWLGGISLLALAGLVILARSSPRLAVWLAGVLVAYSVAYAIVQSEPRHSYPVLWLLQVLAALAVCRMIEPLIGRWRRTGAGRARGTAGA